MRRLASSCLSLLSAFALALPVATYAEPGDLWEIGMEMEGMPFAMPAQKICGPKASKEPPVAPEDGDCKILEKKQTGNRYQWKAQCKEGLMVGDVTSTPTSYKGTMKMTDSSGQTVSMKMSGKRLGACDYQDRSAEIKAMQKEQEATMAQSCKDALEQMQGQFVLNGMCPKEKPVFCQRLATPEGYAKATQHLPLDRLDDPVMGIAGPAKSCGHDAAKLRPRLCVSAVNSGNYDFVSRLCPDDRARLCAKALGAEKLAFIAEHCPGERAPLVKQHCEGRMYTGASVDPKYRDFCSLAAGMHIGNDGSADAASTSTAAAARKPQDGDAAHELEKGVKKLKSLFGL